MRLIAIFRHEAVSVSSFAMPSSARLANCSRFAMLAERRNLAGQHGIDGKNAVMHGGLSEFQDFVAS
ncbi:hypothetical protein [Paraburkholderia franconis]|uniref:hypothetical protein n=1 Tax=Paraburkholderia franconis TaxID=2654983 RepID=UPI001D110F03|nr:hypothetical protein [Paraburkholderia franconis]